MHLMYTLSPSGERIYTLKKVNHGEVTKSAHPARFSPDDKYSRYVSCSLNNPLEKERKSNDSPNRHRVLLKKRYNLLLTQQKSKSSLCSNCSFANSMLTLRPQRTASPSARLKRQTPKAQCERPLPICI